MPLYLSVCLILPCVLGTIGQAGDIKPVANQPLVDAERKMILEGIFV